MAETLTTQKARPNVEVAKRTMFPMFREEFADWLNRLWGHEDGWFQGDFTPTLDLTETDNAFQLQLDLPGMQAKDIDIQVRGNYVTISGQRKEEKEEKGKSFHRIERRKGSFSRSMALPCDVNENEIAADYAQGALTVTLPKCEEAKPKKVPVKG